MLFQLNLSPKYEPYAKLYYNIHTFIKARPNTPETWGHFAGEIADAGFMMEACAVLDVAGKKFGRVAATRLVQALAPIRMEKRGLGFSKGSLYNALYEAPIWVGEHCYTWNPNAILRTGYRDGVQESIPLSFLPNDAHYLFRGSEAGLLVAYRNELFYSETFSHFEKIAEFERNILNISPALSNGTVLLNVAPAFACMAPDCYVFQPGKAPCLLPNTQQTLTNDVAVMPDCFMTCQGGMQANEIRFIFPDGSWKTKFIHEKPVLFIAHTPKGPLSIDESGTSYLWQGDKVIDDFQLNVSNILPKLRHSKDRYSVNALPEASLLLVSNASEFYISEDWFLTPQMREFVSHMEFYDGGKPPVVLLGDNCWHFWDTTHQCVDPLWQLPEVCATADIWKNILPTSKLSIEEDPRIRITEYA